MRCSYCKHKIHRDELENNVYTSRNTGTFGVQWRCGKCGKDGYIKNISPSDVGLTRWADMNTLFERTCDKFFLSDTISPQEMIEFENRGPITSKDLDAARQSLVQEDVLIKLTGFIHD